MRLIAGVKAPDFTPPDEPHSVLADLPLPVYMTTNYDDFMVQALKIRYRDARQELCKWNEAVQDSPSVFDTPDFSPNGSANYGYSFIVRFQGKGVVGSEEWIYDYLGNVVPPWPNGVNQRLAIVGSIVRTVPHSDGAGGVAPAGVICSWIAVRQDQAR